MYNVKYMGKVFEGSFFFFSPMVLNEKKRQSKTWNVSEFASARPRNIESFFVTVDINSPS